MVEGARQLQPAGDGMKFMTINSNLPYSCDLHVCMLSDSGNSQDKLLSLFMSWICTLPRSGRSQWNFWQRRHFCRHSCCPSPTMEARRSVIACAHHCIGPWNDHLRPDSSFPCLLTYRLGRSFLSLPLCPNCASVRILKIYFYLVKNKMGNDYSAFHEHQHLLILVTLNVLMKMPCPSVLMHQMHKHTYVYMYISPRYRVLPPDPYTHMYVHMHILYGFLKSFFPFIESFIYFYVYEIYVHVYVSAPHVCLVFLEVKGRCLASSN